MSGTQAGVRPARHFVPFHRAAIGEDEAQAVASAVRSGWLTMGPKTVEFEQAFADYIGARHAISVCSCTAAMHLILEALGVRRGDEVLVPTLTFAATAEVVTYLGARPVFVDSDPVFLNLNIEDAVRKLTPKTRAIMPVHFGGHPCEMDGLLAFALENDISVVEDAAHALPAHFQRRRIGTIGRATAFSFYATKTLTTGEGGMVTTEEDAVAERIRLMRLHGMSRDAWKRYTAEGSWRYEILAPGFKYNFTDPQAAVGLVQLAKCDAMKAKRHEIASRYTRELRSIDSYRTPEVADGCDPSWHIYYILLRTETLRIGRDQVIQELKDRGVQTSVHFIPLHLQPYYREIGNYRLGDFPVAEHYAQCCISLPIYPDMSPDDVEYVIACLAEIASESRR